MSFFSGNHKLTATAKVIVKICEHEVSMRSGSERIFNILAEF